MKDTKDRIADALGVLMAMQALIARGDYDELIPATAFQYADDMLRYEERGEA